MSRSSPDTDDDATTLEHSRVLIVGMGGLGCPVLQQLAAAGVGHLTILDPDVVELSNLNRQVLYRTDEIGRPKVECAAARVRALFPQVQIVPHAERLSAENLAARFDAVDFVVDATDGAAVKFLINDGAVARGRAFSHAGILGLQGQTMTVVPGRTACLRCLFPEPPAADAVATCQEAGILGAVAGIIGSIQATQAITYLRHGGARVGNRLFTFDGFADRWRSIAVAADPACPLRLCRCGTTAMEESATSRSQR